MFGYCKLNRRNHVSRDREESESGRKEDTYMFLEPRIPIYLLPLIGIIYRMIMVRSVERRRTEPLIGASYLKMRWKEESSIPNVSELWSHIHPSVAGTRYNHFHSP